MDQFLTWGRIAKRAETIIGYQDRHSRTVIPTCLVLIIFMVALLRNPVHLQHIHLYFASVLNYISSFEI